MRLLLFSAVFILVFSGCNKDQQPGELNLYGTGQYNFTTYPPFVAQPVKCFYHIPVQSGANTPVLLVVHGAGRNGASLRNGLINAANEKNFIVLSAEFSNEYFPGSNSFNLANIFSNGEQPSPQELNPAEVWTFQVFDPLFQDFKQLTGSKVTHYDIFGHSAGAQLVHRYLLFTPHALFNRIVSSAAGWYMVPDAAIDFPYGLGQSPAATVDPSAYFERRAYVIVGELDNDPNSFNLRHTPQADAQGLNRVQRAQHFFEKSTWIADSLALEFQWRYHEVPNVGHSSEAMANFAASLLY